MARLEARVDDGPWQAMSPTDRAYGGTDETASIAMSSGARRVTDISAGYRHTCAVPADHTAWCAGLNFGGQLGNGISGDQKVATPVRGISTAIGVASGNAFTCALLLGGTEECWGSNSNGQVMAGILTGTDAFTTPVLAQGLPGTRGVPGYNVCVRAFDPFGNRTFPSCTYVSILAGDGTAPVFTRQPTLSVPAGAEGAGRGRISPSSRLNCRVSPECRLLRTTSTDVSAAHGGVPRLGSQGTGARPGLDSRHRTDLPGHIHTRTHNRQPGPGRERPRTKRLNGRSPPGLTAPG